MKQLSYPSCKSSQILLAWGPTKKMAEFVSHARISLLRQKKTPKNQTKTKNPSMNQL